MFETFYGSFWQHPLLLWVFPVLFLILVRPQGSFFLGSLLVFSVLTIIDPLMTGPITAHMGWGEGTANAVMIVFVLLGDYRFFFFVEHFSGTKSEEPRPGARRPYVSALFLTFMVPLSQAALIKSMPAAFENPRHTFLAYELLFLAVASYFRFVELPRRVMADEVRDWLSGVCSFAMGYYALWSTADVIILAGYDLGFGVRVIPNILYYGLFLPFVYWSAPASLKKAAS